MPHQIIKGKGPLAGHSKAKGLIKKGKDWVNKKVDEGLSSTADRKGNVLQRAAHDEKVKRDDKKFVKKWEGKNKRAKNTRSGAGLSAADRLEARKKHRASQEKKADFKALKKTNPKKYKEEKRARRLEKLKMRTRRGGR